MRRSKHTLDFFPLGCNLIYNQDLKTIVSLYGYAAYGVLIAINSLAFGEHGYYLPYSDPSTLAAHLPDISKKDIDNIVKTFVVYGFFDAGMFKEKHVLTSIGMQKVFLRATARRDINTGILPFWLVSSSLDSDKAFTPPTIQEVEAYCNEKGLEFVDAETFHEYYTLTGWSGKAKGTHIADWKAAARRWDKRARKTYDEEY